MQLPEDIVTFIDKWFEEKGIFLLCPACGHGKKWQPTQYAFSPMLTHEGEFQEAPGVGPLFYVLLPLYCQHCGFIVFFNAGMMNDRPSYFPGPVIDAQDPDRPM